MFFEVTSLSKDGHKFIMKMIVEEETFIKEKSKAHFEKIGWSQHQYEVVNIKKLSTEEMDEHLLREFD